MESLEGYERVKLTIDIIWANVFGILILVPILLVFGIPYYFFWGDMISVSSLMDSFTSGYILGGTLKIIIVLTLGIAMHELIHGITWAMFASKGFKSIKFGVLWKYLTPYCHCKEPLKVKHYVIGGIMPAIILGIAPAIVAIAIGSPGLLAIGMFFTMAACGDFLIVKLLINEDMNSWVQDHPSEAGCYVFRAID